MSSAMIQYKIEKLTMIHNGYMGMMRLCGLDADRLKRIHDKILLTRRTIEELTDLLEPQQLTLF